MKIAEDPVAFHTKAELRAQRMEIHWKKEYEKESDIRGSIKWENVLLLHPDS